jgi:hypothetical protein
MRDRFFYAIEEDRENDIYSIQPALGQIIVELRGGDPTEETKDSPAGLYQGSAFRMDFEPGNDDLFMQMTLPRDQSLSLIAALKSDENSSLQVSVNLNAYTFEVDDALREPYHPREFLIKESSSAACFVRVVSVTSKSGQQQPLQEDEDENEDDNMQEDVEPQLTPEQILNQNIAQGLNLLSKPLQGLLVAVWVLVILVALNLVL